MKHHARRVSWADRVDWRFVSWLLFLALLVCVAAIARLLVYIAAGV